MCLDGLNDEYLEKYIYYYLKWYDFKEIITGSAPPQITRESLSKVLVKNLSKDEQFEIVKILETIDNLISSHNHQLTKLDELVKSRVIEMFGNPVTNPMVWETETLKELTSKIGSGATPKGGNASYKDEGIALIRSMNVYNGYFDYD